MLYVAAKKTDNYEMLPKLADLKRTANNQPNNVRVDFIRKLLFAWIALWWSINFTYWVQETPKRLTS